MELVRIFRLTGWLLALAATAGSQDTAAEAVARRLDRRQKSLSDLTARFVQRYRSGTLGREVVERGLVSIKRPGRMLWEYRSPERKIFVSDGHTAYFYVPADRQVIVREQQTDQGLASLLLSGREGILDRFSVGLEPGAPAGQVRLRLTPRTPDAEMESALVELDEADRVRSVQTIDAQGNQSRFDFEEMKENVGLKDSLFHFQIPRGVEVVTG